MSYLTQFHHTIAGFDNGPKLVFLHGLMGYGGNWLRIAPAFEESFKVLTYDQRGHGRSIKPEHGYSPDDYANDLLKILDELKWKKIHLVGHSMGGRNALNFAFRFPERVEKLVIEDIGPESDPAAVEKIHRLLDSIPTPFAHKRTAKEFFLNEVDDPVLGTFLYSNLEETSKGKWSWRFSRSAILDSVQLGRAQDRWNEVSGLVVPTLVIRGSRSDELSRDVFEKMLKTNKHIRGVEISDAGHWVHFDQPERFIKALKDFFK